MSKYFLMNAISTELHKEIIDTLTEDITSLRSQLNSLSDKDEIRKKLSEDEEKKQKYLVWLQSFKWMKVEE